MTSTPDATDETAPADDTAAAPADRAAPAPSAPAGVPRPARRQSVRGMVLSMLVIGGFVLVWSFLVPRSNGVPQPVVDVGQAASVLSSSELGFSPSVPNGLPPEWKATDAREVIGVDGVPTWRVNYAGPVGSGVWLSLIQGGRPTPRWESTQIIDGRETGTVVVDGRTWVVRERPDRGLVAYVLRGDGVTTMVAGKASRAQVEQLVRATPLP